MNYASEIKIVDLIPCKNCRFNR